MEVKQIYETLNKVTEEVLGKTDLITEDLTGLVSLGKEVFNANQVENYLHSLIDHIGKVVFADRVYSGGAPDVLMDNWEYGSILEKISSDIPEATENKTWELEDGVSYDQDIFTKPKVKALFFNDKVTFEVDLSRADEQVKSAFDGPEQMGALFTYLENQVRNSIKIKTDSLVMRTINNMIGETVVKEYTDGTTAEELAKKSGLRAVNILKLYNDETGLSLTKDKALTDKEFLRYSTEIISEYIDRLQKASRLFNIGGLMRFTPKEDLHVVLLNKYVNKVSRVLQSDTFNKELVDLPKYEKVVCWQGTGTDYLFSNTSKIDIKTSAGNTVTMDGIIGVIFDKYALGVNNARSYVTSHRNDRAEFTNLWFKEDARYFNDTDENFVVFFIA